MHVCPGACAPTHVHGDTRGGCPVSSSNAPHLIPLKMGPSPNLGLTSYRCCFNVHWYFAYMDACVPHAYSAQKISLEVELWTAMSSGFSGKAANTLDHWAISPDSPHQFFVKLIAKELQWTSDLHHYPPPVTAMGPRLNIFFHIGTRYPNSGPHAWAAKALTHWAICLAFVPYFNPPGAILEKRNRG